MGAKCIFQSFVTDCIYAVVIKVLPCIYAVVIKVLLHLCRRDEYFNFGARFMESL